MPSLWPGWDLSGSVVGGSGMRLYCKTYIVSLVCAQIALDMGLNYGAVGSGLQSSAQV